jgi:hypothetical protein
LIPLNGSPRLSAKTISETITLTQAIVQYAGHDAYHGSNPDFADLRSLDPEVLGLTRLSIEPFEEGSFVIPARLEAIPVQAPSAEGGRTITTEDVVRRFDAILEILQKPRASSEVSIGAIQVVESLGRVIRREAEAIEFSSFDALGQPSLSRRVDGDFIARVNEIRQSRRSTQATLDELEGQVTALDIMEGRLQLSIKGRQRRVTGHFSRMFLPSLLDSLGRPVRLRGLVSRRRKAPISIQIEDAELLGDDT